MVSLQVIALKDNDSLAARLAAEMQADLLILMSDVDGIYTAPPSQEGAKMLSTFTQGMQHEIKFGKKSSVGTGGMDSKVSRQLCGLWCANGLLEEFLFDRLSQHCLLWITELVLSFVMACKRKQLSIF